MFLQQRAKLDGFLLRFGQFVETLTRTKQPPSQTQLQGLLKQATSHQKLFEASHGPGTYDRQLKRFGKYRQTPIQFLKGQLKSLNAPPREKFYACNFTLLDLMMAHQNYTLLLLLQVQDRQLQQYLLPRPERPNERPQR